MPSLAVWTSCSTRRVRGWTKAPCEAYSMDRRHRASKRLWSQYEQLPEEVKRTADRCFALLKLALAHPSLRFKKAGQFWSARVGLDYRALAVEDPDGFVWVWIGTHAGIRSLARPLVNAGAWCPMGVRQFGAAAKPLWECARLRAPCTARLVTRHVAVACSRSHQVSDVVSGALTA
jgi:hypothetical protein